MGQGGFARIDGPQAIFTNPAQLGEKTGIFASYQDLLLDTRSQAASAGFSLNDDYSLGLGVHIFDPGDVDGYSADNVELGKIKSGDYLLRLGLARRGRLSYGVSFSFYGQRLDNYVGRGIGMGMGISRDFSLGRLALTADNIGPDFKIGGSSSPLPLRYSISAWLPLKANYLDIVIDLSYQRSLGIRASAGLEYSPISGFFIRAGTNSEIPITVGLGLTRGMIGFDYSYFPSGIFGDRHIFSFLLSK